MLPFIILQRDHRAGVELTESKYFALFFVTRFSSFRRTLTSWMSGPVKDSAPDWFSIPKRIFLIVHFIGQTTLRVFAEFYKRHGAKKINDEKGVSDVSLRKIMDGFWRAISPQFQNIFLGILD